jgi:hypothetical protein
VGPGRLQFGARDGLAARLAPLEESPTKPWSQLTLLAVTFTLLLTQSRAALLGALVGLLGGRHLARTPLPMGAAGAVGQRAAGVALPGCVDTLAGFFTSIDSREGITLPQRVRILVTHAHNQALVVATDLGIPGLVLYAALLGSFAAMVFYTWRYAGRLVRAVLVGLSCGLLAHQVFGLMDAFMLGSKLAALLWIYLGVGAALYVHRGRIGPGRVGLLLAAGDRLCARQHRGQPGSWRSSAARPWGPCWWSCMRGRFMRKK